MRSSIIKIITLSVACLAFIPSYAQTISGRSNPVMLDFKPSNVVANNPGSVNKGIKIIWLDPVTFASTSDKKTVQVKVGINSGTKVSSITLQQNNSVVLSRGVKTVKNTDFDEVFEAEVNLIDGENSFRITIENESGSSSSSERVITYKRAAADKIVAQRTDYALMFAVNDYTDWQPLVNPVHDAKTIAEELEKNYGFKVELVLNPTLDQVMTKLREYALKSYMPKDQLFIFFAGHGQFDETFGEGFIVTKDSKKNDPSYNSYLSHSRLRTVVNNIPNEHVLLVMDACFGGTFDPLIAKAGHRGYEEEFVLTSTELIERKLRFKTRRYMTSGGKEYVPDGRPGAHSPFARKLLEALRTYGGKDRILTISEIQPFLEVIKPEPRSGEFGDNEPGSDFVFVVK
jgi:hypothetical protein